MTIPIGEKIKWRRKMLDLSQAELCRRVGLFARPTLVGIENGQRLPSADQLQAIEAALDMALSAPEIQAAFALLLQPLRNRRLSV